MNNLTRTRASTHAHTHRHTCLIFTATETNEALCAARKRGNAILADAAEKGDRYNLKQTASPGT
jgi:hypothetical protein